MNKHKNFYYRARFSFSYGAEMQVTIPDVGNVPIMEGYGDVRPEEEDAGGVIHWCNIWIPTIREMVDKLEWEYLDDDEDSPICATVEHFMAIRLKDGTLVNVELYKCKCEE